MNPLVSNVVAVILGGGRGSRLQPLTAQRAKPAVPIGGKYRLIDIPISNCINSGLERIAILTQFNSVSLHRHISQTYRFDNFHNGWVQVLAAEQRFDSDDWYQGTADAVRKQLIEIEVTGAEHVLILAGDHLYRMDYTRMIASHLKHNADITMGVIPVKRSDAKRFGILRLGDEDRCTAFVEKPTDPAVIDDMRCFDDPERPVLGSMGIYLFRLQVLVDVLNSKHTDFGRDIIPEAIHELGVYGHPFDDYWEDIGTIRAFYEANLALAQPEPPFSFHNPRHPFYTRARHLPGSRITGMKLDRVMMAEGCVCEGGEITNAVIGIRSVIRKGAVIRDTVMLGADHFEHRPDASEIPLGVGEDCRISCAILDRNVRIGRGVVITPFDRDVERDERLFSVRDGIVVVPKNTVIPNNTIIGPPQ